MTALFRRRCHRARGHAVVVLILALVALSAGTIPARASGGTLSVDAVTIDEPAAGVRSVVFTVSLARADDPTNEGSGVTVDYATADGTATAGRDYVAVHGSTGATRLNKSTVGVATV